MSELRERYLKAIDNHRQHLTQEQITAFTDELYLLDRTMAVLISLFADVTTDTVSYTPALNKSEAAQMLRIQLKQVERRRAELFRMLNGDEAEGLLYELLDYKEPG